MPATAAEAGLGGSSREVYQLRGETLAAATPATPGCHFENYLIAFFEFYVIGSWHADASHTMTGTARSGDSVGLEAPWTCRERWTAMDINIDKLTEPELIDLNHRIVARLRFLGQMRAHVEMLDFRIGDRVTFQPTGHGPLTGMLTRYNKKTVTVITDDGRQWNVSPSLLSKMGEPQGRDTNPPNVILLGKR